jgi:hypothetical protein
MPSWLVGAWRLGLLWGEVSCPACQEIPRLLWNRKDCCCVYKSPPLDPFLRNINSFYFLHGVLDPFRYPTTDVVWSVEVTVCWHNGYWGRMGKEAVKAAFRIGRRVSGNRGGWTEGVINDVRVKNRCGTYILYPEDVLGGLCAFKLCRFCS